MIPLSAMMLDVRQLRLALSHTHQLQRRGATAVQQRKALARRQSHESLAIAGIVQHPRRAAADVHSLSVRRDRASHHTMQLQDKRNCR